MDAEMNFTIPRVKYNGGDYELKMKRVRNRRSDPGTGLV